MARNIYYTQVDYLEEYRGKSFEGEWPTIGEAFSITVSRFPDNEALKSLTPSFLSFTFREAYEKIAQIAYYIKSKGIKKGDNIAVCGKNSPQWALAYLAITFLGCVIVPLDHGLRNEELERLLDFGDVKGIFADEDKIQVNATNLEFRISLECGDSFPYILDINGEKCTMAKVDSDDTAAILFTSGTTGNPKGVVLTHTNLVSDAFKMLRSMTLYPTDVVYAVLPIHHAYTMLAVFMEGLGSGASVVFGKKLVVTQMLKELKEAKVTMFLGVPMIFNKLYAGLLAGVRKKGVVVYGVIRFLMGISGFLKKAFNINIGKKMFGFLLKNLSLDNCRICICGGGPLPSSTFKGFNELGLDFVQGYGLTETSPITHLNPIYAFKEASVGKNVALTEAKIVDPDSEGNGVIYIKGPQVMKGYYKNQEATDEILSSDGWINTGDVGHLDSEGYLYLTGRAKSIIVTEGGKNVFPEEIEDKFQLYDDIEQICIIGYLKDKAMKVEGIRAIVYPSKSVRETMKDDEIQEKMEGIIKEVNKDLQSYKKINMVTVAKEPLEMTSTKKIKRFVVAKQYSLD